VIRDINSLLGGHPFDYPQRVAEFAGCGLLHQDGRLREVRRDLLAHLSVRTRWRCDDDDVGTGLFAKSVESRGKDRNATFPECQRARCIDVDADDDVSAPDPLESLHMLSAGISEADDHYLLWQRRHQRSDSLRRLPL
jgi:hypothetical protein